MRATCFVRKIRTYLICAASACVMVALVAGSAFGANFGAALPKNDLGLSFGTVFQAEKVGQPLDLLEVQATNGRYGYVYNNELEEAENRGIETPEEAEKVMSELEVASERALSKHLSRLLPSQQSVTPNEAAKYLESVIRQPADEVPIGLISQEELDAIDQLSVASGVEQDEMMEVLDEALSCATREVQVMIPVYESDGQTQIGEFAVGSLV